MQTEDSGVDNPHIITHLFVGGNIIETRKTSYADIVSSERLNEMLVELMQDQHKGMLKDLISGRLDQRVDERSVNAATLNGPAPLNVDAGAQHRTSFFAGALDVARSAQKAAATPAAAPAITAKPAAPFVPAAVPPAARPVTPPNAPIVARPPPAPIAVPPPLPPSVFAMPPVAAMPPVVAKAPAPPAASTPLPPQPAPDPLTGDRFIEAETLARAFESQNESAVDSIFGEDLISEKSLDEVILSYLAEDMQKE